MSPETEKIGLMAGVGEGELLEPGPQPWLGEPTLPQIAWGRPLLLGIFPSR